MHHTNFVFNNFLLGFPKLLHYELFANVWNAEAHILWVKFGDVQHLGINGTGWIMIKKICFPLSMAPRNWYGYAIRWGVENWHEFPLQWRCWLEKILCVSAAVLQFYFLIHIVFFPPSFLWPKTQFPFQGQRGDMWWEQLLLRKRIFEENNIVFLSCCPGIFQYNIPTHIQKLGV